MHESEAPTQAVRVQNPATGPGRRLHHAQRIGSIIPGPGSSRSQEPHPSRARGADHPCHGAEGPAGGVAAAGAGAWLPTRGNLIQNKPTAGPQLLKPCPPALSALSQEHIVLLPSEPLSFSSRAALPRRHGSSPRLRHPRRKPGGNRAPSGCGRRHGCRSPDRSTNSDPPSVPPRIRAIGICLIVALSLLRWLLQH